MSEETQPTDIGIGIEREHRQGTETHVRAKEPTSKPMPVEPKAFVCPVEGCDYSTDKWGSFVGHGLGKHSIRFKKEDFIPEEVAPTPPRGRKTAYRPTLEQAGVPDPLSLLKNQLVLYGLSVRDSDAVTDFMKSYQVDDLVALNKALTDVGMARNRKTLFLESWVNARRIPLDYELQEQLGLFRETEYLQDYDRYGLPLRRRYDRHGRRGEEPDEADKLVDQAQRRAIKLATIKSLSGSDEGIAYLKDEVARLRDEIRNDPKGDLVGSLFGKIEEMGKKIDELEKNALKSEISSLREDIKEIKQNYASGSEKVEIAREIRRGFSDLFRLASTGTLNPEKPPKYKKLPKKPGQKTMDELLIEAGGAEYIE